MKKQKLLNSALVLLVFLIAFYGRRMLSEYTPISFSSNYLKLGYFYFWWVFPTALIAGFLFGFKPILETFGMQKGFSKGLLFSAITVLPMFLSSAAIGKMSEDISVLNLLHHTLFAGFMEEFLFRGFLFGLLFRKLGWGFIPASLLGALIFGLGHLYQGHTVLQTTGVFFVTALGAVWFAWLYIEWNANLWVPIFLHTFMNLSWSLFEVSDTALGGWYTNLFRIITIALTIIITIKYANKTGLIIRRKSLLLS